MLFHKFTNRHNKHKKKLERWKSQTLWRWVSGRVSTDKTLELIYKKFLKANNQENPGLYLVDLHKLLCLDETIKAEFINEILA